MLAIAAPQRALKIESLAVRLYFPDLPETSSAKFQGHRSSCGSIASPPCSDFPGSAGVNTGSLHPGPATPGPVAAKPRSITELNPKLAARKR